MSRRDRRHLFDRESFRAAFRMRRGMRRRLFVAFGVAIAASFGFASLVHRVVGHAPYARPLVFVGGFFLLWGLAGGLAGWFSFPLSRLLAWVRRFGRGDLSARSQVPRHAPVEFRELGAAFDAMADRIEGQLRGQREMLAAVSHELRTPLARMRLLLELRRERGLDLGVLDELEREIEAMDVLVGGLLAGARVDAGAIDRRALELVALAREAVVRASERDTSRSYALEAEADRVDVDADPALVARALAILLDNAIKHGGGEIVVRVRAEPAPELAVEDDGPGIPASDRARVFEPFVRGAGEPRDERHGVGLGLHLVRRIADAHGGAVFAETARSGGARVGLSFGAHRPQS